LLDTGPDDVFIGLLSAPRAATAPIAGFHLFPFGGLRKAADWARVYRQETPWQMAPAATGAGVQNP
jgi:methylenetetrahydrofolate reductase (NADPH)